MRLPGAYRSLPRPSSALKPSHPSHSVVTSKNLFTVPTAGVGAYTWLHRRFPGCPILGRLCPSPPTLSLGVARFFDFEFWVEHDLPRTFRFCLRR